MRECAARPESSHPPSLGCHQLCAPRSIGDREDGGGDRGRAREDAVGHEVRPNDTFSHAATARSSRVRKGVSGPELRPSSEKVI